MSRQQAADLFSKALAQTPEQQREFEATLGEYFDDFIKNVLRQAYAAPVAQAMGSRIPLLQQEFLGTRGGDPSTSFLAWLAERLNLSSYG